MRKKASLFYRSVRLVWQSSPGYTVAGIILSLAASVLPLALVWLIKKLTDAVTAITAVDSPEGYAIALWTVIAIAVIYFLDESIAALGALVRKTQNYRLGKYMHNLLHSKSVSLDLRHFEDPSSWDTLSRASREAPFRPASIINNLVALLRSSLSLLLIAGLIFMLNWVLIVILILANIPGIWLRIHYSEKLYNFRRETTPEERKSVYFNWILTGDRPSREMRLFDLGSRFRELFNHSYTMRNREEIAIVRRRSSIEIVSGLFKAAAAFLVISYLINETSIRNISLGDLAMYLLAFRLGMSYIWQVLGSVAGLYEDSLFVSDLFSFLDLTPSVTAPAAPVVVQPFSNSLKADNIIFRYPGAETDLLKGISLEIKKGETVALVGDNGAGKSTLVRLLTRLYDPQSGHITLDGTDIRNFDPAGYRQLFSVILQDFMLYNLTAGENISLGDISSQLNNKRIVEAAGRAGIHGLIKSLPQGYDTVLGRLFDDSRELSWGEWQKLALARALYRDAPLLILDEPASSLDTASESELFNSFREITRDRTALLISHRFSNISMADRILVLGNGQIIESGTHSQLMDAGGTYATRYMQQKNRYI